MNERVNDQRNLMGKIICKINHGTKRTRVFAYMEDILN